MKRPIKFRGRVPEGYHPYGGQTVYGSLVRYREDAYWAQGYPNWIVLLDGHRSYPVDEDSIAQLVGFDRDGAEVYEGDIVEYTSSSPGDRASQRTKTAPIGLCPQIYADDTDHNKPMRRFKLKEATK